MEGPIALQSFSLTPFENYRGGQGVDLADLVAESGGILGGVSRPTKGVPGQLEHLDDDIDLALNISDQAFAAVRAEFGGS